MQEERKEDQENYQHRVSLSKTESLQIHGASLSNMVYIYITAILFLKCTLVAEKKKTLPHNTIMFNAVVKIVCVCVRE